MLGSWTNEHVLPQKYQELKRLPGIWSWKSQVSLFGGLLLAINWTVKGPSTFKQNKTIASLPPFPPLLQV